MQHSALKDEAHGLRSSFADAVADRQSLASTLRDVTMERDGLAEAKAKADASAAHAAQAAAEAHTQVYEMKVAVEETNAACEAAKESQALAEAERDELSVSLNKETESKAKLQLAFEEQSWWHRCKVLGRYLGMQAAQDGARGRERGSACGRASR